MTHIKTLKVAQEAMNLARAAHGQMLLSDPPQEAWKAWDVSAALSNAIKEVSQAIEQAEQAKPMLWISIEKETRMLSWGPTHPGYGDYWVPLYTAPPQRKPLELDAYDAGLFASAGGGDVDWWWDYIRAELGRAHDFYQAQADQNITGEKE